MRLPMPDIRLKFHVRRNEVTNPKPVSMTGWRFNGGTGVFVPDDGGEPALEFVDAAGTGLLYADPNDVFRPALGKWVAVGYDLCALDPDSADNMRLTVGMYNGTTVSDPRSMTQAIARPRVNLVKNPSFETGTTGWTPGGGTMSTYNSSDPRWWSGSPEVQKGPRSIIGTADGANSYLTLAQLPVDRIPLIGGRWVGVRGLIASDALGTHASRGIRMDMALYGGAATQYAASGPFQSSVFYTGRSESFVFQVPADVTGGQVRVQAFSGNTGIQIAAGQRLWADAIMVVQANTQAEAQAALDAGYFDGATSSTPDARHVWSGVANASTSRELREYERLVHAVQVTAYDPTGFVRPLAWPLPDVTVPDNGFRLRRAVVAFGNTESEARGMVSNYWDGDSPGASWTGAANASASQMPAWYVEA